MNPKINQRETFKLVRGNFYLVIKNLLFFSHNGELDLNLQQKLYIFSPSHQMTQT